MFIRSCWDWALLLDLKERESEFESIEMGEPTRGVCMSPSLSPSNSVSVSVSISSVSVAVSPSVAAGVDSVETSVAALAVETLR